MSDHAPVALPPVPAIDPWYFDYMGRAALELKSRRDLLRVIDGSRRMLGEKTPRPALKLKLSGEMTREIFTHL